jgi:hypothetical protein
MKINNSFIVIAALSAITAVAAAFVPHPREDGFKNLKVLPKNITAKELDKIMDGFNEGLGVKCGYCHSKNADTKEFEFEKDTKSEKEMARKMIVMTNDINHKYFPQDNNVQAVSCYTCHHGNPMPAVDTADFSMKAQY